MQYVKAVHAPNLGASDVVGLVDVAAVCSVVRGCWLLPWGVDDAQLVSRGEGGGQVDHKGKNGDNRDNVSFRAEE